MFIVCPKCFTKYLVSDEIQVTEMQKCHCSTCGHYFEQKVMREEVVQKDLPVMDNEKNQELQKELAEKEALDALNESLPTALFSEPLNTETKTKKTDESLLSVVPEEFKPVENKKSSFLGTLLWLSIGAGICFLAYNQKDYLLDSIDTVILSQLDKSKTKKVEHKLPVIEKKVEAPVPLIEEQFLPIEKQEVALTPAEQLPVVDVETPVGEPLEVMDKKSCLSSLVVQNVGYEIGANEVGVDRLLIKGAIVNTSLKACPVVETKAVIYDDEDNIVARKRIVFNDGIISGNSDIFFETAVVPSPKSVSKIEVVFDE